MQLTSKSMTKHIKWQRVTFSYDGIATFDMVTKLQIQSNPSVAMALRGLRLGLWVKYLAGFRLAPFVPTPHHVAKAMLRLADVKSSDFVVDLGCGDARLLISAAKDCGAKGYGVEMDGELFKEAVGAIGKEGLSHMISVHQKDAMDAELHMASVVTLYLSDAGNAKILPKLQRQLPPNGRVVSFCWPFKGINPLRVERVDGIAVYLYDFNRLNNNTHI